jgi:hypothetical protein
MNKQYHVVADGFDKLNIVNFNPNTFHVDSEQQKKVDVYFERAKLAAEKVGGVFYDGDMIGILVDSFKGNGNNLNLELQKMKYSQHAGLFRSNRDSPIQAAYVAGLVVTADNYLVFGTTQQTEAQFMGKLGLPAGGLEPSFADTVPSFGLQLYKEMSEEIGFAGNEHIYSQKRIVPGWMTAMSTREGNYHFSTSFVVPHKMTKSELNQYFTDWKNSQEKLNMKTEFKQLTFLPNDSKYLNKFIDDQVTNKGANLQGKSLDILEEWVRKYNCDILTLEDSKKEGTKTYLPQPYID